MPGNYLKWSICCALLLALCSVILSLFQIASNLGSPSFKDSESSYFGSAKTGALLLSLKGPIQEGEYLSGVERLIKNLEKARKSSRVRAVLLWINSPGGTVGATKRLYEELLEVKKKKPIVAVIGDLAASGAYYAASACSWIIASKASTIGSIGVLSVHLELHRFLERHGIRAQTLKAGRFKDIGSPFRSITETERKMYQELLDDAYRLFLNDVASGRKQKLSKVRSWAEGKIFSAKRALALGMIDALGGSRQALHKIKELLKTKDELELIEPVRDIEFYLERYFSGSLAGPSSIYKNILKSPLLYLYPQMEFMRAIQAFY